MKSELTRSSLSITILAFLLDTSFLHILLGIVDYSCTKFLEMDHCSRCNVYNRKNNTHALGKYCSLWFNVY